MQTTVIPQSGIQLIILIGAAFVFFSVRPDLGTLMLAMGLIAWLFYNLVNVPRQF